MPGDRASQVFGRESRSITADDIMRERHASMAMAAGRVVGGPSVLGASASAAEPSSELNVVQVDWRALASFQEEQQQLEARLQDESEAQTLIVATRFFETVRARVRCESRARC